MCIGERIRRELMVQLSMLNKGRGRREGDVFRSKHQKVQCGTLVAGAFWVRRILTMLRLRPSTIRLFSLSKIFHRPALLKAPNSNSDSLDHFHTVLFILYCIKNKTTFQIKFDLKRSLPTTGNSIRAPPRPRLNLPPASS